LVINKTDLAPYVDVSLDVMREDAARMRGAKPFVTTSLKEGTGISDIVEMIEREGLLETHSAEI